MRMVVLSSRIILISPGCMHRALIADHDSNAFWRLYIQSLVDSRHEGHSGISSKDLSKRCDDRRSIFLHISSGAKPSRALEELELG